MQGRIFAAAAALGGLLALGGCATGSGMSDAEKLASYEAAAGEPVKSFTYLGRISGWTPLDERNIAVWTRPKEAWLLGFSGPCLDIEYTPAISLTNQTGRVYAGFDKVIVQNRSSMQMPCRIAQIRPLDTARIKAAEKAARDEAQSAPSGT
ncbi:DUF6491 family protein [Luteimonas sp. MJ204]|uniref:DUF6491 family protein n=1 Tax=Luteimonas sp. MJ145 TaxID=3129234 RepID=UPI0031BB45CB